MFASKSLSSVLSGAAYSNKDRQVELEEGCSCPNVLDTRLTIPNVPNPAEFCHNRFNVKTGDSENEHRMKFLKGTTTLAFRFQGGVIVSVDSRSTQGNYIASQSVKKVIEINPYLLGTMAGGAADCQYWERLLGMSCRHFELVNKKRISVAAASKTLSLMLYPYRRYGLSVGTMIAGWDTTGPQLYFVDNEGTRLHASDNMPYFSVGSGSPYAYGVLDTEYRWDLTDEEAITLGKRAIYCAAHRDGMSGGINNLYLVKEEGWKHIYAGDVNDYHYEHVATRHNNTSSA